MGKLNVEDMPNSLNETENAVIRPVSRRSFSLHGKILRPKNITHMIQQSVQESDSKLTESENTAGGITGVRKLVGSEESVVQEYKKKKKPFFFRKKILPMSSSVFSPKIVMPKRQSDADLSTIHTITRSTPPLLKPRGTAVKKKQFWGRLFPLLLVLGGAAVVYFYPTVLDEFMFPKEKNSQGMPKAFKQDLQETKSLKTAYIDLQNTVTDQRNELRNLHKKIRNLTEELKTAQQQAVAGISKGKLYREELMRITTQYEIQLGELRQQIQTQMEIMTALKAQIQALEKIFDESGFSGIAGAASKVTRRDLFPASREGISPTEGQVTMLNSRYRFIVIDKGYQQGAHFGQLVRVFQNGNQIAEGSVDRTYPTMSAVLILNPMEFSLIREGDVVSLSD